MTERRDRHGLHLVPGGKSAQERRGGLLLVAATRNAPPFEVDAVVVEEDTYFVLGASPEVREPPEHPIRVWTAMHEMDPVAPGSVHLRRGRPARLLAVVHDLSEDPTWREEWIAQGLARALAIVGESGFRSVGTQILGAVHGRLTASRFLALLQQALERSCPAGLERLWLICEPGQLDEIEQRLARDPAQPSGSTDPE